MQRTRTMVISVTALVVGCAAAVAVPLVRTALSSDGAASVSTFGSGAPTALAGQTPTTPTPRSTPRPIPSSTVPTSMPRSAANTPSTAPRSVVVPPGTPASTPTSLRISGTGIAAPVVPVGVDAQGEMAIPERVDTVGWYRFGPALGATAGSTVLVGHVDSAEQGEGAFFRLRTVGEGATVTVTGAGGRTYRYRVVGRQEYPKTSVPLGALFTRTGAPHLTLITCGGSFDAAARSYRDNVVVTAVPIP